MNKIIFSALSFFLLSTGCKESPKVQGVTYFFTDMDGIVGWKEQANVFKTEEAHSGDYVSKVDTVNKYSITFDVSLNEVNEKWVKVREAKATIWVYFKSSSARASLITEIKNGSEIVYWNAKKMEEVVTSPHKWIKVEMKIKLTSKKLNNEVNHLRVYAYNDSKEEIYFDDFSVEFIR